MTINITLSKAASTSSARAEKTAAKKVKRAAKEAALAAKPSPSIWNERQYALHVDAVSVSLFSGHAERNSSIFRASYFGVVGRDGVTFAIAFRTDARSLDAHSHQLAPDGVGACF
jgi:hypothetical protein